MATANANVKKVLESLKSKGTIVEEWHDGSEWYRVWSSGFIEQGGTAAISQGLASVTLRKAYSGTNYHVSATVYEDETNTAVLVCKYPISTPKGTSAFTLKVTWDLGESYGSVERSRLTWTTMGY